MPTYLKYEFIFFSLISIYGRIRIRIFFQPDPDPHFFPAGSGSVEKHVGSSSMFSSPPPLRNFFPYSIKLRRARQHPKSLYPVFFKYKFSPISFLSFCQICQKTKYLEYYIPLQVFQKRSVCKDSNPAVFWIFLF